MEPIALLLLVAGFVLFIIAAIGIWAERLVAIGLACWILTEIITRV